MTNFTQYVKIYWYIIRRKIVYSCQCYRGEDDSESYVRRMYAHDNDTLLGVDNVDRVDRVDSVDRVDGVDRVDSVDRNHERSDTSFRYCTGCLCFE